MPASKTKRTKPKQRTTRKRESRTQTIIPNFIAEWRTYRGYKSQHELAEASGVPSQTVCRLERHTLAYTFLTLDRLAKALRCEPGDLISRHPLKDGHMLTQYDRLSPDQRQAVIDFVNSILGGKAGRV